MRLPGESSSLQPDLDWISFVLESALWKILYLVCKMCKNLYNNYNPRALRYQSSHNRH